MCIRDSMYDDDIIIYALKPVDFVLLSLCCILVFYILPLKLLKRLNRGTG